MSRDILGELIRELIRKRLGSMKLLMPELKHVDSELLTGSDAWVDAVSTDAASALDLPSSVAQEEARQRKRHRSMLRICGLIVVMAFLLQIRPDHRVQFRWGPSVAVPETCGAKILFNVECPGCGLTRSFIALSRGDIWQSWNWNRVGPLLALAVLLQFPYRIWSLRQLDRQRRPDLTWPKRFGTVLIVLLIGNWICKVCGL